MRKLLLKNGTIIDGTGNPAQSGDVLLGDDRILAVGQFEISPDTPQLDCAGLVIAPGFIDGHNHLDLQVLSDYPARLKQGITSEIVGNCGFSPYPCSHNKAELHEFANGILCGSDNWGWTNADEYLRAVMESKTTENVGSLIGHGSLRIAVAGNKLGRLSEAELDAMEQILTDALTGGACGFSTGLMYAPGASAPFDELERLCEIVARHNKIYTTHIRSYFSELLESIEEQIELARRTGCRLQISHLQAVGAQNWHLQIPALEKIAAARAEGIDIAFDCYPYVAGSTVLTQVLPQEFLAGGAAALVARLQYSTERKKIAAATEAALQWRWQDIFISAVSSAQNQNAVNKNLAQLSETRGKAPVEVVLDLLREENCAVNIICFNQSEENLRATLTHELSNVISDGFYVKGQPHPRLHGTFPKLLGEFCRDKNWLSLESAIQKITSIPARRFALPDVGELRAGYFADVVVFDPVEIGSAATYNNPEIEPVGVKYVFRKGRRML